MKHIRTVVHQFDQAGPLRLKLRKAFSTKEESKHVSDLVRESIQRYITIYKFRKLRNKVLPFAESQGILTDEDVFKIISCYYNL